LLFGAIFGECTTCKAQWELYKSQVKSRKANEIEKFFEEYFFKNVSSPPEKKKRHSEFSGNWTLSTTNCQ